MSRKGRKRARAQFREHQHDRAVTRLRHDLHVKYALHTWGSTWAAWISPDVIIGGHTALAHEREIHAHATLQALALLPRGVFLTLHAPDPLGGGPQHQYAPQKRLAAALKARRVSLDTRPLSGGKIAYQLGMVLRQLALRADPRTHTFTVCADASMDTGTMTFGGLAWVCMAGGRAISHGSCAVDSAERLEITRLELDALHHGIKALPRVSPFSGGHAHLITDCQGAVSLLSRDEGRPLRASAWEKNLVLSIGWEPRRSGDMALWVDKASRQARHAVVLKGGQSS